MMPVDEKSWSPSSKRVKERSVVPKGQMTTRRGEQKNWTQAAVSKGERGPPRRRMRTMMTGVRAPNATERR